MYMSFFASGYSGKILLLQYLKRNNDKTKIGLQSKLISLSECQLQQENDHIQKTVGDKVTTSKMGRKRCYQYKYSAKERANIGKYSTELLQLPYLLCHLDNTRTLN